MNFYCAVNDDSLYKNRSRFFLNRVHVLEEIWFHPLKRHNYLRIDAESTWNCGLWLQHWLRNADICMRQIVSHHLRLKATKRFLCSARHDDCPKFSNIISPPGSNKTIERLCAIFKPCPGERPWKAIRDRLRTPYCLSKVEHVRKMRSREQRADIGKYSLVNRIIKNWNQLPAEDHSIVNTNTCTLSLVKIYLNHLKNSNMFRSTTIIRELQCPCQSHYY